MEWGCRIIFIKIEKFCKNKIYRASPMCCWWDPLGRQLRSAGRPDVSARMEWNVELIELCVCRCNLSLLYLSSEFLDENHLSEMSDSERLLLLLCAPGEMCA